MKNWWNWLLAFSLFCLMFLAIPLMLPKQKSNEELKLMFNGYINKFNKNYSNQDEYDTRFQHFVASVQEIEKLNAASRGPDSSRAKYGLTRLSDMSKTEFQEIHLSDERVLKAPHLYGKSWNDEKSNSDYLRYDTDDEHRDHRRDGSYSIEQRGNSILIRKKRVVLPLQVDWYLQFVLKMNSPLLVRTTTHGVVGYCRHDAFDADSMILAAGLKWLVSGFRLGNKRTKGVIGPVKNQGLCGACWAFSTVGTIEAMSAIDTGKLQALSVQEAIDCAGLGNKGCAGGDICLLLDWFMIKDTPIEKETDYPLRLSNGACKAKKNATGVKVQSFTCDEFVGAENKILEALALHGPVAVAVNALTWQNYLGGVIQFHCSGAPADLNHAVELVGYDLTDEVPYYIAKNSWGKDFGNDGYINLAIGSNICGLANEVATVTVK